MKRLTKIEYGLLTALNASLRSEDPFTKVGAALFEKESGYFISASYNGLNSGRDWPEEFNENRELKKHLVVHAEKNLNFRDPKIEKTLYLTMDPCESCSTLIAAPLNNVKEVYTLQEYKRDKEKIFLQVFEFYGIKFRRATKKELYSIHSHIFEASKTIGSIYQQNKNEQAK